MKIRLRLSIRILLLVLGSSFLIIYTTTYFVNNQFKKATFKETIKKDNYQVEELAYRIKTILNKPFVETQTISTIIEQTMNQPYEDNVGFYTNSLKKICENNSDYTSVWICFEMSYVDPKWSKEFGRQEIRLKKNSIWS